MGFREFSLIFARHVDRLRLDSGSNTGFAVGEVNNTIHANVAMLTNGLELKNDFNTYTNNLALWGPPPWLVRSGATSLTLDARVTHCLLTFTSLFGTGASSATEVLRVDATRYAGENSHSIVQGNVVRPQAICC